MDVETVEEALTPAPAPQRPARAPGSAPSPEEIRYLVAHAILAPSGGNCQPWRFSFQEGRLDCHLDTIRSTSFVNFAHLASHTAIGAAGENIVLAARRIGLDAELTFPEDGASGVPVCRIQLARGKTESPPLLEYVARRSTNRQLAARQPLAAGDVAALARAAGPARLTVITEPEKLERIGAILGRADRLRFLDRVMHEELIKELRWTKEEVNETRDGLDLATLEFDRADMAVLRILSSWPAMERVSALGGGRALEQASRKGIAGSSAVALLTMPRGARAAYATGGMALERVWLTAASLGLGVHPLGLPYFFARLERSNPTGFTPEVERAMRELHGEFRHIFADAEAGSDVILMRLVHAPAPRARSLRRPVGDVLLVEGDR